VNNKVLAYLLTSVTFLLNNLRWFKALHEKIYGYGEERPNIYEKFGEYNGAEARD